LSGEGWTGEDAALLIVVASLPCPEALKQKAEIKKMGAWGR